MSALPCGCLLWPHRPAADRAPEGVRVRCDLDHADDLARVRGAR